MATIIINTDDPAKTKALYNAVRKLDLSYKKLTRTQAEDLGLSFAMKAVDRTKKVSRDTIMKNLKN